MGAQVRPIGKALFADCAQVRLLPSVRPEVTLKQPGSREGLSADVTPVVEVVSQDVHGKRGHGDIHLAADVALLGAAGIQTSMRLLVPRQVGAGGVVLAALRTSVF